MSNRCVASHRSASAHQPVDCRARTSTAASPSRMQPTIGHQVHLQRHRCSARRTQVLSQPALDDSIAAVREYPSMAVGETTTMDRTLVITATFSNWPRAGAPSIDFVATLLTAVLHPQRLLWSRQIEHWSDRTQSSAVARPAAPGDSNMPGPAARRSNPSSDAPRASRINPPPEPPCRQARPRRATRHPGAACSRASSAGSAVCA
jgi:hypothetical protein